MTRAPAARPLCTMCRFRAARPIFLVLAEASGHQIRSGEWASLAHSQDLDGRS